MIELSAQLDRLGSPHDPDRLLNDTAYRLFYRAKFQRLAELREQDNDS